MAIIPKKFGRGNSGHAPAGGTGKPSLVDILNDVADDFAALKPATVATANATDLPSAIALANALKGAFNAVAGYTIKTVKET